MRNIINDNEISINNQNNPTILLVTSVDKEDKLYRLGDEITFRITCTNKQNNNIDNLLIEIIIPNEVLPIEGNYYKVDAPSNRIIQCNNIIKIYIDTITPNATITIFITGKIVD